MNLLFLFRLVCLLFLINLFSSCNQHFYRPRSPDPVLLTHKKQLTVKLIGEQMGSVSIAYSPLSNFGLQAGVAQKSGNTNSNKESNINPYISTGYYKNISGKWLLEVYSGLGFYCYNNESEIPVRHINFSNYFLQPSFAFLHKDIDIVLTIRGDYLKRNKTIIHAASPADTSTSQYSFLRYSNYYFLQPGVTLRAGIKNVKLLVQVNKSYPLNKNYMSIYGRGNDIIINNNFKIAVGVMIDFEDLFQKKK